MLRRMLSTRNLPCLILPTVPLGRRPKRKWNAMALASTSESPAARRRNRSGERNRRGGRRSAERQRRGKRTAAGSRPAAPSRSPSPRRSSSSPAAGPRGVRRAKPSRSKSPSSKSFRPRPRLPRPLRHLPLSRRRSPPLLARVPRLRRRQALASSSRSAKSGSTAAGKGTGGRRTESTAAGRPNRGKWPPHPFPRHHRLRDQATPRWLPPATAVPTTFPWERRRPHSFRATSRLSSRLHRHSSSERPTATHPRHHHP